VDIVSWANAKLEQQKLGAQQARLREPEVDCQELLHQADERRSSPVSAHTSTVNPVIRLSVCVYVLY
jgi:hypothetical protein